MPPSRGASAPPGPHRKRDGLPPEKELHRPFRPGELLFAAPRAVFRPGGRSKEKENENHEKASVPSDGLRHGAGPGRLRQHQRAPGDPRRLPRRGEHRVPRRVPRGRAGGAHRLRRRLHDRDPHRDLRPVRPGGPPRHPDLQLRLLRQAGGPDRGGGRLRHLHLGRPEADERDRRLPGHRREPRRL